ncbi:MAG: phosphatidylglycerol lysyltransferase domain-containing protein [Clostridiales bacterium]|nr:phosphatidylglycerol lysyltransferase domain-containing protein [Clostridiales bacterium]
MWREYFDQLYTVKDGMLICTANYLDNGTCFAFPVGKGDLAAALCEIKRDRKERGLPLRFCCVTKEGADLIESSLGAPVRMIEYRDWADYLYPYENFIGYHGKKLVTPRNHCNRFVRDYPQYVYSPLDGSNVDAAKEFLIENAPGFSKDAPLAVEEYKRATEIIDYCGEFGFTGGLLTVDGKVIGLSIGEKQGDTLYVHVEKALTEYSGAYPMLASLFAKQNADPALRFINREDDSGDPGLRKSKTEYRPCSVIMKYVLCYD